jgi:hypothetical protein
MQRFFQVLVVFSAFMLSSCVVTKAPNGQVKKTVAPGQVKKVTGSKSAKPYAPGQVKKKKK